MSRFKTYFAFILLTFGVMLVNGQSDLELENVLERIFSPTESSMHALALRRDIIRRLYEALDDDAAMDDDPLDYKRSINSLARWGQLPGGKRNLAALARAGYIRPLGEVDDDDNEKRSIANLAKNGQLPTYRSSDADDKRNIGSLARGYNFPVYKKNVAALRRLQGKRNVAALLRQDKIHGPNDRSYDDEVRREAADDEQAKRNLASLKASASKFIKRSARAKRSTFDDFYEINDEYAPPVYQNQNIYDYEELMKALTGEYPNTDKRFLGSVARGGWFQPVSSRIDKRHIGSLARLGWLPSFRTVRRFNRSGRSISECDRETAADGESKDYGLAENQLQLDDKRYFIQPHVDKLLLHKLLMQQRARKQ